jgi:N6-adenosine-specific RNA methylase IME4
MRGEPALRAQNTRKELGAVKIDQEFKSLIPPLSDEEYKLLEESILNEGCRDAIVIWNGTIVDGHNRYEICTKHNIPFKTVEKEFSDRGEAKIWIAQNQIGRRNLNAYQRSLLALKLRDMIATKAKENQLSGLKQFKSSPVLQNSAKREEPLDTRETLAKMANVSHDTIEKVQKIEEKAPQEVKEKLLNGKMSIHQAYKQVKAMERKEEAKKKEPLPIPEGKYNVIYLDPPWPVGSIVMDKWESPIEDKYPTMSLEEIEALPVRDLANNNCSLFMWTTHTFLPAALKIIDKWGFKYHCLITWDKGNGWTQFGFNKRTEFLIYAYVGKMNIDPYGKAIPTLISEPKTYHSKKPDIIRKMIEEKVPAPRLEMFARDKYDGWTVWGNEEVLLSE